MDSSDKLRVVASKPQFTEYKVEKSLLGSWTGRKRSGSFSQTFDAFQGDKQVGSATIQHHVNDPTLSPGPSDISENAYRQSGVPITHLFGIKNFTQYEYQQVPGVGTALMNAVEDRAKEVGSTKMTLMPAPGIITRPKYDPETMEMIESNQDIVDKSKYYETFRFDPTSFYQHKGYDKDPEETRAKHAQLSSVVESDSEALRLAKKQTSHLSKSMK